MLKTAAESTEHTLSAPRRKILLADDSKMFQHLFKAALDDSDCELFVCGDSHEALELIGRQYIDFVCSAFYLPDMEGIELCRRVRRYRSIATMSSSYWPSSCAPAAADHRLGA